MKWSACACAACSARAWKPPWAMCCRCKPTRPRPMHAPAWAAASGPPARGSSATSACTSSPVTRPWATACRWTRCLGCRLPTTPTTSSKTPAPRAMPCPKARPPASSTPPTRWVAALPKAAPCRCKTAAMCLPTPRRPRPPWPTTPTTDRATSPHRASPPTANTRSAANRPPGSPAPPCAWKPATPTVPTAPSPKPTTAAKAATCMCSCRRWPIWRTTSTCWLPWKPPQRNWAWPSCSKATHPRATPA